MSGSGISSSFTVVTLKAMKRAASCKHRLADKNIQCEKKLFKSHLHSSTLGKRVEKHATSTTSCPLVVVKTNVKLAFLM